jgi:hypothetical protein
MENPALIFSAIDNSLDFVGNHLNGLLHTVYSLPDYMIDDTKQPSTKDWRYWKPLNAIIPEADFSTYETQTGIKLPASYKTFLGYKFFMDLNFGHEVVFFKHTKNWLNDNLEKINMWRAEFTIEKGLLPFADFSDWGLLCFDANKSFEDNEYNIVYIDHEDIDNPKEYKHGRFAFLDLIKEMNGTLNEWKQEIMNE